MLRLVDPAALVLRAIQRILVPLLAYWVLARRMDVPWWRVPAALLLSLLGARQR